LIFTWDITVPANTQDSEPVSDTLKLGAGVITHIGVKFPAGCHGMVGVRLKIQEAQILPVPRGEWVSGDDETVDSDYHIEFTRERQELEFEGISPDTDYNHTISVRITMLPAWVAAPYQILSDLVKIFKRILGVE